MEHEVTYDFEDEGQFWIGRGRERLEQEPWLTSVSKVLEETVSKECDSHDSIDNALRSYIDLIGACRGV
jgi:hypothetical protein